MQRCSIWTVSLAAALSLTGAAWADHEGGGGHGPAASHGTTPTFAKQRGSDEARESHESHSGAQNSGTHSAAGANFAARLANNPTLSARLLALMPSGTTIPQLMDAAKGFRNQGQFIAALHAAKDLGISFATLKAEMTGADHDSLGQAIHELKPSLDATTVKTDVTNARNEAKADLQAVKTAKEAAEDAKEAAKEKTEDAKEAAKEKAEDAKEAAEEAREGAKAGANFAARLTARLANDPTLAAQLKSLLPMGMSPQTAAMGFRNLSQLLTALNAAKDLGLDFGKLQQAMTGPGHDSLAQAILDQKPTLDPTALKTAIMTARNETKTDLKADRAALEAAEDAKEATKEAAEDAKEAAKEAAEDAKEAAEEANEAAKAPAAGTTTTGTSASKP
jgi:hypothetical protein